MQDVAQLGSDPSLYSGWRNFVGAASAGEESGAGAGARGLYMEAKDEEGGVWLLDPLALVASYGVEDEVRAYLSHHPLPALRILGILLLS